MARRSNKLFVKKLYLPDGKLKGQNDKMSRVTASASEINTGLDGLTATAAELNLNDGQTATAAEVNQLDASANAALMTVGAGISAAATAIVKYSVDQAGGVITTKILIDLTGLQSGGAHDDIFGDPTGAGAKSHFGQITTAVNGVIWGGDVRCFETPAGCNIDVNFNTGTDDAGAQDGDVKAITGYVEILNGGNQAGFAATQPFTAIPAANAYLYLSTGVTTDVVASAGRFLITLYGYVA